MNTFSNTYLWLICIVSAMGGFLFGYDWVVIGGAKIFYEPFFNLESSVTMRGWAMSCALIGCLIGALLSGRWSDKYGRKPTLFIAAFLFIVSAIGTGGMSHFSLFILFRILGGIGIGIASNVSPIYIAEVAPAKMRGKLVSLNQLTIVLGILLAQIVNYFIAQHFMGTGTEISAESERFAWRWMFWAGSVPALLFFVFLFFIPESPQWLLTRGKKVDKTNHVSWKALLHPKMRKVLILGIVLAVFQQWCGINVIFNYAHEIFSAAGYAVSDVMMNIVVTGVTNLIFTFVALYTVDRWGRRRLMFVGSIGLTIVYALMGLGYKMGITGLPMLLLVIAAIACYAMSLAPVVWVVLSEIFPAQVRGRAMAIATFFLWVACFVLTYTFPLLNKTLGAAGTFWVYGFICFIGFLFLQSQLPETKGKKLEEIEKELCKDN